MVIRRSYVQGASESNTTHYSTPTSAPYRSSAYPPYSSPAASSLPPDASPEYPHQAHHEHHGAKDTADPSSGKHAPGRHPYQEQSQPSPQSRPPFLKINTAVRQSYPNQQSSHSSASQRVSPQHAGSYPQLPQPGSSSSKGTARPYVFPALSSSAQSSPVTNIDYQSYIPPPLTPKDDHVSPTSTMSPANNLKRKSIHHDAVMDAVRAKVFRNAAGQVHQQREQLHKKTSLDNMGRRRAQLQSSSPERLKRASDNHNNGSLASEGPKSKAGPTGSPSSQHNSESRPDGPLNATAGSPTSPSSPGSANAGSVRSRSSSPPSATAASEAAAPTKSLRDSHNGYSRATVRNDSRGDSGDDDRTSPRYEMDRTRTDRSSEVGVK
ncbi:hypothetical protein BGX34_000972 [Mortierella sp. NVP85]|nr:hypothetical protein BGX34_000972 [Mortierella sp. NVP85]